MNGKIEARLSALNRGEILHYLGYSGQKIDSTLSAQIDRCAALVTKAAVPRLVWVRLPMEHKTVFDWESRDLESLLDDCREHILLAATIGAGVDQLIHRYEISNMADAVTDQDLDGDLWIILFLIRKVDKSTGNAVGHLVGMRRVYFFKHISFLSER